MRPIFLPTRIREDPIFGLRIECASPRQAWRAALKLGWIGDDTVWLDMLDDRNRASHTYNEATAEAIFLRLRDYEAAVTGLLDRLRSALRQPEPGSGSHTPP